MKRPRSQKPSFDRMKHRLAMCREVPVEQQAAFYYGSGMEQTAFLAAVTAGEKEAVALALDVLAAGLWLRPRDRALFGCRMREALYTACKAGKLQPQHRKAFEGQEYLICNNLLIAARHSVPGAAQQRASRRLLSQQAIMHHTFGAAPDDVCIDEWPPVVAPVKLLRKAVQRGWFFREQAEQMAISSTEALMSILHAAGEVLPAFRRGTSATQAADTLCYFFCERADDEAVWLVAPWRELDDLCGVILAADGSFCYVVDDWGDIYGCC